MKRNERILTGALVLALCLALAACGGEKPLGVVKHQETGAALIKGRGVRGNLSGPTKKGSFGKGAPGEAG